MVTPSDKVKYKGVQESWTQQLLIALQELNDDIVESRDADFGGVAGKIYYDKRSGKVCRARNNLLPTTKDVQEITMTCACVLEVARGRFFPTDRCEACDRLMGENEMHILSIYDLVDKPREKFKRKRVELKEHIFGHQKCLIDFARDGDVWSMPESSNVFYIKYNGVFQEICDPSCKCIQKNDDDI